MHFYIYVFEPHKKDTISINFKLISLTSFGYGNLIYQWLCEGVKVKGFSAGLIIWV